MSARAESSTPDTRGGRPPGVVRAAAGLVVAQGLVGIGFAVFLLVNATRGAQGASAVLGEGGLFALIGLAVVLVGWGLARGRFWARTPAIVVQLLLLPVAYSLLVPSHQLIAGLAVGAVVLAALLLLLSTPAKTWALNLDDERRRRS